MTRKRWYVFLLLLAAFILSFLAFLFDFVRADTPARVYNVSVIVRGKNSDSWANIKQGADQAASEMHVELSFITLSEQNSLSEQMALLRREMASGVDAIVISAADSAGLVAPISRVAPKVPVICIESKVDSDVVASYISADNYAMGVQLGEEIVRSGNARKRLAVVDSSMNCMHILERRRGLMSVLEPIGGTVDVWSVPDDPEQAVKILTDELAKKQVDVIVTLDFLALDQTAQVVDQTRAYYLSLFGIGSTDRIAYYLEQDIVSATVVQNDFGIGYLGVKAAVDTIEKKPVSQSIIVEHRLISGTTMYEPQNQRLLFPFIR